MGKIITTEMIISDNSIRELMDDINSALIDFKDDLFVEKEKQNKTIRYFAKPKSNYKSKKNK